jgi:hypothetical protein
VCHEKNRDFDRANTTATAQLAFAQGDFTVVPFEIQSFWLPPGSATVLKENRHEEESIISVFRPE